MKNIYKKIVAIFLLLHTYSYANNEFELNLNNDSMELALSIYANDYYVLTSGSDYYVDFAWQTYEGGGKHSIWSYGIRVSSPFSNSSGTSVAVGLKGIKTEHDGDVFFAVPIAFFLKTEIDDQLTFEGRALYSPVVLNYFDAKSYREFRGQVDYAIVDSNAFAFGGYKYIKTNYQDFSYTADKAIFFGIKVEY
jgi:hypothetical protein